MESLGNKTIDFTSYNKALMNNIVFVNGTLLDIIKEKIESMATSKVMSRRIGKKTLNFTLKHYIWL